jgi:hypothetical protein
MYFFWGGGLTMNLTINVLEIYANYETCEPKERKLDYIAGNQYPYPVNLKYGSVELLYWILHLNVNCALCCCLIL